MENIYKLLEFMFLQNFQRDDLFVAVGGGVITDFGGFAASIFMRGIGLVLVPTTLLGMCDASIGSKTAVNNSFGKNLIGSFYDPKMVLVNVNFLKTLDQRNFNNGVAEIIKMGLI